MMRVAVVCVAALLLSSCAWVRHEIGSAPAAPAVASPPAAKPDTAKPPPHKPHAERPAQTQTDQPAAAVAAPAPPAPDYSGRCHAMAQNRADDARQLGATAADQAKMLDDTYRDCMAQSR